MTVKFSKKWHEKGSTSQNLSDMHKRLMMRSHQSVIERVLYCNRLTSGEILSLVHSSVKLIEYLIETFSLDINQCKKGMYIFMLMQLKNNLCI